MLQISPYKFRAQNIILCIEIETKDHVNSSVKEPALMLRNVTDLETFS